LLVSTAHPTTKTLITVSLKMKNLLIFRQNFTCPDGLLPLLYEGAPTI
jgi:hypothetical protein